MKDHLVNRIEDLLSWGEGDTWGNKDFEELSERIFNTTNKRLSVTTLKRIWGRTEWVANPSVATLDILSQFIGHENWREFVRAHKQDLPKGKDHRKSKGRIFWTTLIALVILGSFLGFLWNVKSVDEENANEEVSYESEDIVFSSRAVSTGIPNSVVFDYDVSGVYDGAKIEIQQDWDDTKRIAINKKDSTATSIYYRPGFFKSKLVINSVIVKESDVFISTQDWLGVIERNPHPIYLKNSDIFKGEKMAITPAILAEYDLDPRTERIGVSFYQVKDFGELYTTDFEMSAILKNDFKEGVSGACQRAQVYILYDGGAVGIPLAKKGCASDFTLMTFEKFINGKKHDLSGFGVDFSDFVTLTCVSKNQKLDILINNQAVYQMNVPKQAKKIKGISIHFEGAGSVQHVAFSKDGTVVYIANF